MRFIFTISEYFFMILFILLFLFSAELCADEMVSRSVAVMDASTGEILYAKNPYLKLPPASTTKLMTAIVAMENRNLSEMTFISGTASRVPPHNAGFSSGDQLTVEQLLHAALIGSANDAAVALAESVAGSEDKFVHLMNSKAVEIGALDTRFINASGLPGPGQYITAYDLARIMRYALQYQKLMDIMGTRATNIYPEKGNVLFLQNTNLLLWSEKDIIAGKTGFTRKAMHCFVCAAQRRNETIIVAVLGSPSRTDLWQESSTLISKGFEAMTYNLNPVVYVTDTHFDDSIIRKTSYSQKIKLKARTDFKKGKKISAQKKVKHSRNNLFTKKKETQKKKKVLVKKRGKSFAGYWYPADSPV